MNSFLMSDQIFFPRERFLAQFAWKSLDLEVYLSYVALQSTLPAEGLAVDVTEWTAE